MPDQSANRATLRLDGHKVTVFASFFTGASVLTGAVSATPATSAYPITTIAYTTSTGSSANVRRGYRVIVKTSAGVFKFATTVRASGTISSTALPIRESSRGSVRVVTGDLIEVRSVMHPGDKLTEDTVGFEPDGLTYTNQNASFPPVVCSGGPWAGPLDTGQTYATVATKGDRSYSLTGAAVTHLWTLPTGVTFAPGSAATDANPTLRAVVGEYLVEHQGTDATSAATWVQYMPIKVGGETDIILDSPPETNYQSGAFCTLELFGSATLTDIPDGTLVVVWMRYTIGGALITFGSATPGRHHILMAGYTNGDTIAYSDGLDTLTMDIVSPLAWYAETLGLSKVGLRDSTPTAWQDISGLTAWIMVVQILRWYTWVTESWDVTQHTLLLTANMPALFITEQDAIAQVRELITGLDGQLACLRNGWFEAQPRLELSDRGDRATFATTIIHGDPDILEYEFRRDHRNRVKIVRTSGIRAATTTGSAKPLFAKSPGAAPGDGTITETYEKLMITDATDHYERNGKHYANAARIYVKRDGSNNVVGVYHAPSGRLTLPYIAIYDLDPEWLGFDPAMQANLRGDDLSVFRWIRESIGYELDDRGAPTTVLQIKAETDADDGVDDTPPAEETNTLPPFTSPTLDFVIAPLPPPPAPLPTGVGTLALLLSDGTIARTTNFSTPAASLGPAWNVTYNVLTLLGSGTSLAGFAVDAFSPGYPGGGSVVGGAINAWILTGGATSSVARLLDIFGTPSVASATTLTGDATKGSMNFERGLQNWGALAYWDGVSGVRARYTLNGTLWTAATGIPVFYDTAVTNNWRPGIAISPHTVGASGIVRISAFTNTNTGAALTSQGYKSTDGGATYSSDTFDPLSGLASCIVVPFQNTSDSTINFGYSDGSADFNPRLYRILNGGAQADISPVDGSDQYGPTLGQNRALAIADDDRNTAVLVGHNSYITGNKTGVFFTRNLEGATVTWTTAVTPATSVTYVGVYALDRNTFILIGDGDGVAVALMTIDAAGTITIDDRTGDLVTSSYVVGIAGGGA